MFNFVNYVILFLSLCILVDMYFLFWIFCFIILFVSVYPIEVNNIHQILPQTMCLTSCELYLIQSNLQYLFAIHEGIF